MLKNKVVYLILFSFIGLLIQSCDDDSVSPAEDQKVNTSIAVFSDPHLYDASLGITGEAFQTYLMKDRKLIVESEEILKSVVTNIKASEAKIVLVPGDLTKDGTKLSHDKFASYLKELEDAGKQVYVVPGNHDINNPESFSYSGSNSNKVENITPTAFTTIYNEFGYSEAIAKDPNSLSYIAEPVPGLLLVAMDPCRYNENAGLSHPITSGRFSDDTIDWIINKIENGVKENKTVIGMMHHGLLEHFEGQKQFFSEYVVDDYINCATKFAQAGMKMVFTGHFHAHDITKYSVGNKTIYDIETGSLVTAPCPYRIVKFINSTSVQITSAKVEAINFDTNGKDFQTYAEDYLEEGLNGLIIYMLQSQYGVDLQTANMLAPYVNKAMRAHYKGNENISPEIQGLINQLSVAGDANSTLMAGLLNTLFSEPEQNDLSLTIDLNE